MLQAFFDGITSYGKGVRHVNKHGLWGYILLPAILSILLGVGVIASAWGLSDNVGDLLDNLWRWEWGRSTVALIAQIFGGLLVFLAGLIVFKQLVMVISAPFMSILSEKVENQLLGKDSGLEVSVKQILADIARGLRIALRNILREIGLTLVLLILSVILPILSPITTVLAFTVQAYYAGFGNMDFTLERHFRYSESVRFVQSNKMLAIGNGTVFIVLLFTFVGFPLALPLGTVAATIETTKRLPR